MTDTPLPLLSLLETRVLGVLVEKQHTVPDTYPLTLNALVAGCNQKTSRDPVLNATDAEVQAAVDQLRSVALVVESSGGRVRGRRVRGGGKNVRECFTTTTRTRRIAPWRRRIRSGRRRTRACRRR